MWAHAFTAESRPGSCGKNTGSAPGYPAGLEAENVGRRRDDVPEIVKNEGSGLSERKRFYVYGKGLRRMLHRS